MPYLKEHGSELVGAIREGTYRVVYQGINLVLEAFYEFQFSETSYDFRLHCGAHQE
ncbi:MAG: hypothetical protein KHZ65_14925 [Phocaeicola vulgatus]|nr:hypothetical protein [Phocaeicola vulgatus]